MHVLRQNILGMKTIIYLKLQIVFFSEAFSI